MSSGDRSILFSSSAGIFGELKTLPIAEDHPQEPDSPHSASKLTAEKMCLVYNKLCGVKNVRLRYFSVCGVRQRFDAYGNVIPIFAEKMLRGEPVTIFGDGEQTRDFVHASDVAQANYCAGISDHGAGSFNLGSGTRMSINAFTRIMSDMLGRPTDIRHGDPHPGDVRDSLAAIDHAWYVFGFQHAMPLDQGLREYLAWLQHDPAIIGRWARQG